MSKPEPRTGPLAEIELLEIAPPPRAVTQELAARLSRLLGLPCRVTVAPESLQPPALPGRNQLDADRLLELVEALDGPDDVVRVAVTACDIGHPIFTHFFGRARRGGRAAVVSFARLDPIFQGLPPDSAQMLRRAAAEVLHELGHLAGLGHCLRWACVMHFAATVEALDQRGEAFCQACAASAPAGSVHAAPR